MATDKLQTVGGGKQRGAVLIVTLICLLLVTLVTFAAARSSTTNMRIAVAQEVKTATFQAAESAIETMSTSTNNFNAQELGAGGECSMTALGGDATCLGSNRVPSFLIRGRDTAAVADDVSVTTSGLTRFRREAATVGNSIRKGGGGFQTFHYDVSAVAQTDGSISTLAALTQGVYIEAPRVN